MWVFGGILFEVGRIVSVMCDVGVSLVSLGKYLEIGVDTVEWIVGGEVEMMEGSYYVDFYKVLWL